MVAGGGVAVLLLSAGCNGTPGQPGGAAGVTYALTGRVQSTSDMQGVAGATIEAAGFGADGESKTVVAQSGLSGEYNLAGLRQNVGLRVTHPAFHPVRMSIALDQSRTIDLLLEPAPPLAREGADLEVGTTVSSSVGPADVRCDPNWWNVPCRNFGFQPPATGLYRIVLRFPACREIELQVRDPGWTLVGYGDGFGGLNVEANLRAGQDYLLRLMAESCEWFEITVR